MVCSGTPVPDNLLDYVDYYIYDSTNELLSDPEFLPMNFYKPSGTNWSISSSYFHITRKNTHLPSRWKLNQSILFSKSLDFDILHFIDFDSVINKSSFYNLLKISENNILHNGFEAVHFSDDPGYLGIPISLNLKKDFPPTWFHYPSFKNEELEKIKRGRPSGKIQTEAIIISDFLEILGSDKILNLPRKEMFGNKFGLHSYAENVMRDFFALYYDHRMDKVGFFIGSSGTDPFKSSLEMYVNGDIIYKIDEEQRIYGWRDMEVDVKIKDLSEIRFFLNGEESLYRFKDTKSIETFKVNSWKHYV